MDCLARLEEQDGNLSKIKVDEVSSFVGHVRAKVPANNAMPRRIVFPVELFLDKGSNILKEKDHHWLAFLTHHSCEFVKMNMHKIF